MATPDADGVRTWADGFGLWHAAVSLASDETLGVLRRRARVAILAELSEREGPNFAPESVRVTYEGLEPDEILFVEVQP